MAFTDILKGITGSLQGLEAGIGGIPTFGGVPSYPVTTGYPGAVYPNSGGFVLQGGAGGISGAGSLSMGEILILLAIVGLVVWAIMRR